jgi:hypothetical protein
MNWKHLAIVAGGVVVAAFIVPRVVEMLPVKRDPNTFGMDDIVAAVLTAGVIVGLDSVL